MRSVRFQQLIYTSFDRLGYQLITGIHVPVKIQNIFMEKIVQSYWHTFYKPGKAFQLSYLYQIAADSTLFGWLYIDQLQGQTVPYFVCYYLSHSLDSNRLEQLLTCLNRGPMDLLDRRYPLAFLEDIELDVPEIDRYKPSRIGVDVSLPTRKQCTLLLEQGQLIHLSNPQGGQSIVEAIAQSNPAPFQTVNQSSQRTLSDRRSLQSQNILAKVLRGNVQLHTLLAALKIPLNRASLITLCLLFTGSASALILPQWIAKQHQTVEVTPEILEESAHSGSLKAQPSQIPNRSFSSPSGLTQDVVPNSPAASPFSDLNLQPQSPSRKSSASQDSRVSANLTPAAPATSSEPSPTPRSQEHLFSTFRVQESPSMRRSTEAEPNNTSYASQAPSPSSLNSAPIEQEQSETTPETLNINPSPTASSTLPTSDFDSSATPQSGIDQ